MKNQVSSQTGGLDSAPETRSISIDLQGPMCVQRTLEEEGEQRRPGQCSRLESYGQPSCVCGGKVRRTSTY
ncbi:MAG: hypothetical protein AAB601_02535 [Patescibacteria group bacterium]